MFTNVLIARDVSAGPTYDAIALEIAAYEVSLGSEVTLVEIGSRVGLGNETRLSRACAFDLHQRRETAFARHAHERGLTIHSVQSSDLAEQLVRDAETLLKGMHKPADLRKLNELAPTFGRSVYSTLITDVLRSYNAIHPWWRRRCRRLIRAFALSYSGVGLPPLDSQSRVIVPNGRFPHQAGLAARSQAHGCSTMFYERGGTTKKDTYYLDDCQTTSVVEFQKKVLTQVRAQESWKAEGGEAVRARRFQSSSNIFARDLKARARVTNLDGGRPLACLLTSSDDEFIDIQRPDSEWPDQWTALLSTSLELQKQGFQVLTRVHPNALNKTWREFFWTESKARGLSCEVIGSYRRDSTYDLIDLATVVIVWGSTSGLEALASGKRVGVLGPSYFSNVRGVNLIHSLAELKSIEWSEPAMCDEALAFLGYLQQFGKPFRTEVDFLRECSELEMRISRRKLIALRLAWVWDMSSRPKPILRVCQRLLGERATNRVLDCFFIVRGNPSNLP